MAEEQVDVQNRLIDAAQTLHQEFGWSLEQIVSEIESVDL